MVGYIYLITDTTNGMKYTGKHHYHIEGQLDPNYHGSGTIIKNIYKKRPETLKEEYIKTCYSEEEMCSDEQYYIKVFKTLWPNGYNLTEGGDGVIPCEETKKKMSESHKGKYRSDETKQKISETKKGKYRSDETKQKISEAKKGKQLSEETKKKLSEAHSGEKHHFFGKHHSEETKQKMSESHKGKQFSVEHKQKMSESHKGKHLSVEHKRKISEAAKRREMLKKMQPDGCLPLW